MTDIEKALRVLVQTPHIYAYLSVMDPKALEQAKASIIELREYNPLPDLRDVQVIWDALQQFVDNHGELEEVESIKDVRKAQRAQALIERIEAGMVPLMLREDRINAEEDVREARKAAMADPPYGVGKED